MSGWAAAAQAASGIGGNLIADAANRDMWVKQKKYQTYMSNTAHQREVRDLRKAGLNPILSATGGAGASSPNAPSWEGSQAGKAGEATASAIQNAAVIDNLDADSALKKAQQGQANSATAVNTTENNILKLKEGIYKDARDAYDAGSSTIKKIIPTIIKDIKNSDIANPMR